MRRGAACRGQGEGKPNGWEEGQRALSNPTRFIDGLHTFKRAIDEEKIPATNFRAARAFFTDSFKPELVNKVCGPTIPDEAYIIHEPLV